MQVGDLVVDVDAGSQPRRADARPHRDGAAAAGPPRRPPRAHLSKTRLLAAVWGYDDYDPNLVEVHVSALRRKLGEPRLLHTARGLGYVLRAEQ